MKRWQQLLSFCLVLCVALAGAVGLSPALHVFVEHGGHGASHTHLGAGGVAYSHEDVCPPEPGVFRTVVPPAAASQSAKLFLAESKPLTLFGLQPQDMVHAFGRLIAKALAHLPAAPSPGNAGHTHHSLAQMLINGVVEGAAVAPLFAFAPEQFTFVSLLPDSRRASSNWYAPTAGRGPPCCC